MEKVGMSNPEDSTISHKAEVLQEAEGEGPKSKRKMKAVEFL
jgi:hypothetical protein